jgi:hypothetical protein
MLLTLLILIILISLLITLLFTVDLKVKIVFDTCKTNLSLTLLWLHSFLKALVTIEDSKPMLTLYFFNRRLFKRKLKTGKSKISKTEFMKLIDSSDVHVNASYGFRDPFTTGITCGAFNAASQFINIDSINQMPDFTTENDYIYLDASANVNLGTTLLNLSRFR